MLCGRREVAAAADSYTAAYLVGAGTGPPGLAGLAARGCRLMRVSVSNRSRTGTDVDRSVGAVLRVAGRV